MSRKNIEKYIPEAIEVLSIKFKNGKIPSSYNGYISSFGASIIQSGLKPTLALFENQNNQDNTREDRSVLPKWILKVLDKNTQETSLLRYVINNNEELLKQKIIDVAIALKLSIRTFELDKGE